jgi:hypothetical protein
MPKDISYRCNFCQQGFKSETRFLKHKCKEMVREEKFKSLTGQAAWNYYKDWMKLKHKSMVPAASTFKNSKFFTAFYNFATFVKKAQLPDVNVFIDLMVRTGVDPNYWASDAAYRRYLEHVTRKLPAKELAKITIKTMFDVAEAADVDVSQIFNILTPNEVIQLLHQRRFSPWILLNSKNFADFYVNHTTKEEKIILETIMNPDYWKKRFEKYPQDLEMVKQYIKELGL